MNNNMDNSFYMPSDFECLEFDYLKNLFDERKDISIRAKLEFYRELKINVVPFLYIGKRVCEDKIIDLISIRGERQNYLDSFTFSFPENSLYSWYPYQEVLRDLVVFYTNQSIEENLREDIYQLNLDWGLKNFHGANIRELNDIQNLFPYLLKCFSEEYHQANTKVKQLIRKEGKDLSES